MRVENASVLEKVVSEKEKLRVCNLNLESVNKKLEEGETSLFIGTILL